MNELEALAALVAIPYLGPVRIKLLVEYFGSPLKALNASIEEISYLPGFGIKIKEIWEQSKNSRHWEKDLELAERLQVRIIPYTSPFFPKKLLELPDHPILLYMQGEVEPNDLQGIAIVGTRSPTPYGKEMGEKFGRGLAEQGVTVVSGLARGIDTAAHLGALCKGRTLAVIGSGLANIYPKENWGLAKKITARGALISEFSMLTPPDRQNFPQRNRIVSGMTQGTVLIEAPKKSGAMLTMEKGDSQGRALFALPGRADCENFTGNHFLIKTGKAKLVESVEDILHSFGQLDLRPVEKSAKLTLEKEEQELWEMLPQEEFSAENLCQLTGFPFKKISILLMSLLLKRAIKEFPGRLYKKVSV